MKLTSSNAARRGLTRKEALIVIGVIALVAFIFLPALHRPHVPARRIQCLYNLKHMGEGLRLYSNDHDDNFPWNVPPPKGAQGLGMPDIYRVCSNEFKNPKILVCPADTARKPARNWAELSTNHLSYFIGLDADEAKPQTILSGDRNLTGGVWSPNALMLLTSKDQPGWSTAIHNGAGNIGLGDGSAQQTTTESLRKVVAAACVLLPSNQPLRLLMP